MSTIIPGWGAPTGVPVATQRDLLTLENARQSGYPIFSTESLHGNQAVDAADALDGVVGNMTPVQYEVASSEGYNPGVYADSEGIWTQGVGQTGKYVGQDWRNVVTEKEDQARRIIPSFSNQPDYLQARLVNAGYRGDLLLKSGKPQAWTRNLESGEHLKAAKEMFRNEDYYNAKAPNADDSGVATRFEDTVNAILRAGGLSEDAKELGQQAYNKARVKSSPTETTQEVPNIPTHVVPSEVPQEEYGFLNDPFDRLSNYFFEEDHLVIEDDNLTRISKNYDVPLPELMEYNRIKDKNKIKAGQTIAIPSRLELGIHTFPDTLDSMLKNLFGD